MKILNSVLMAMVLYLSFQPCAFSETYSFGVLNQRSLRLTAMYWNPILDYVGMKAGVNLLMKMGNSTQETDAMTARGEFDFIYSNHIFMTAIAPAGYKVILRPDHQAIQGQIVVPLESSLNNPKELQGKNVSFPSKTAFVGYSVPMDYLTRSGITVTPVFADNQEGAMAQLKAGAVTAAAVNSQVMQDYAQRTHFRYRALWTSQSFLNLPVAVLPKVPEAVSKRVQHVMDTMDEDAEGHAILKNSAEIIHQEPPYGFRRSSDKEYQNYHDFYKHSVLRETDQ